MSIEAMRELETLASVCPELNMANYTEDDVRHLNDWAIEMSLLAEKVAAIQQAESSHARLPGVLKDHQIADMVNSLRDIALQFHGHGSLRERIANVLVPALKTAAKTDEPVAWGWAIVDNKGLERRTRARIQDFFGSNQEAKPFSLEDVAREDREFAGCAPHRVITLFTHPAPGVPMTDAGVDEMRSALEWIARVNAMDYEYQRVAKEALRASAAKAKKGAA